MRLKDFVNIGFGISDNSSCKKHTAGFSAYHARAYHVVADAEIVLGAKMLFDHLTHFRVPCHHDIAHITALFRDIRAVFVKQLRFFERPVPRVHELFVCGALSVAEYLIEAAGLDAVENWTETAALRLIGMRQEHCF